MTPEWLLNSYNPQVWHSALNTYLPRREERMTSRKLFRQPGERMGQHRDAGRNLRGRGVFIRPMADAAAARNEDHRGWAKLRHEQRIVIGPADHRLRRQLQRGANFPERRDHDGMASRRRIRVDQLQRPFDTAAAARRGGGFANRGEHL